MFDFTATQNLNPPDENINLYQTSPRLIVRLLFYSGSQEPDNDIIVPEVINGEFPLHVIYEEETSNMKKEDE